MLGALIDLPDALRYDPMLIKRLHRMRDERDEARHRRTIDPNG